MRFGDDALTDDAFLGGRLAILQPREGYRAGIDPVLLAAAVPAADGESVLELGCGVGTASLCLGRRLPGLALVGLEVQPGYADLARRNAERNGIGLTVEVGDLREMPSGLRARTFDHLIANPPYYLRDAGTKAADTGRETALGEVVPLGTWVQAGMRRLKPRGRFTMIQRADRLADLLLAFDGHAASIAVRPIIPRVGRDATLVLLCAVKGGKSPFRIHAPFVLHDGDRHERDGDDYAPEIAGVLRRGDALPAFR